MSALRVLLHTAPSPQEDLALEEAIHLAVEAGESPNTWRLWQAELPALVLGTGQEAAREVDLNAAADERAAVVRRHSGGGAVLIGPGVLNYSAFYAFRDLPGSETIRGAMSAALRPILAVLANWKLNAREAGLSDLVLVGDGGVRKISGNAQARKKSSVVVHGTLLADPDWTRLARLLRYPSKAPDYRLNRGHRGFLTSLRENGAPYDLNSFAAGLPPVLGSDINIERAPTTGELKQAAQLARDKYSRPEWNLRR